MRTLIRIVWLAVMCMVVGCAPVVDGVQMTSSQPASIVWNKDGSVTVRKGGIVTVQLHKSKGGITTLHANEAPIEYLKLKTVGNKEAVFLGDGR